MNEKTTKAEPGRPRQFLSDGFLEVLVTAFVGLCLAGLMIKILFF